MVLYLLRLGTEEKFYLHAEKDRFLIGRNESCDITFTSLHISRQHCEIQRLPPNGTLIIKNLKETNRTYVDDLQLADNNMCAELRIGSRIGLGVPLTFANENHFCNRNFVFLSLCTSQTEPETREEDLNQTVTYFARARRGSSTSGSSTTAEQSLPQQHVKNNSPALSQYPSPHTSSEVPSLTSHDSVDLSSHHLKKTDDPNSQRSHLLLDHPCKPPTSVGHDFTKPPTSVGHDFSKPHTSALSLYTNHHTSLVDSNPTCQYSVVQHRVELGSLVSPTEQSKTVGTCPGVEPLHEPQITKQAFIASSECKTVKYKEKAGSSKQFEAYSSGREWLKDVDQQKSMLSKAKNQGKELNILHSLNSNICQNSGLMDSNIVGHGINHSVCQTSVASGASLVTPDSKQGPKDKALSARNAEGNTLPSCEQMDNIDPKSALYPEKGASSVECPKKDAKLKQRSNLHENRPSLESDKDYNLSIIHKTDADIDHSFSSVSSIDTAVSCKSGRPGILIVENLPKNENISNISVNSFQQSLEEKNSPKENMDNGLDNPHSTCSGPESQVGDRENSGTSSVLQEKKISTAVDSLDYDSDSCITDLTQDHPLSPRRNGKESASLTCRNGTGINENTVKVSASDEKSALDISDERPRSRRNSLKRKRYLDDKAQNESDDDVLEQSHKEEDVIQSLASFPSSNTLQSVTEDEPACTTEYRRKSKLRKLSIDFSSDNACGSSTGDKNSEIDMSRNSVPVKNGLRACFSDCKKECCVAVNKLPKHIIDGIKKGKTVMENADMDLILLSPTSCNSMDILEIETKRKDKLKDSAKVYIDMDVELPDLFDVKEPSTSELSKSMHQHSKKRSLSEEGRGSCKVPNVESGRAEMENSVRRNSFDHIGKSASLNRKRSEMATEETSKGQTSRNLMDHIAENTLSVDRIKSEVVTEESSKGQTSCNMMKMGKFIEKTSSSQKDTFKISSAKSTHSGSRQDATSIMSNVRVAENGSRQEDTPRISNGRSAQGGSKQEDTHEVSNVRGVSIKEERENVCPNEVVKIKEEKVDNDNSTSIVIKQEPLETEQRELKATSTPDVNNDENDDDDVIFMYSQMDDTIWISSDDDDETPQKCNSSFGPLPPSPDLDIKDLFEENENDLFKDDENGLFLKKPEASKQGDLNSAEKISPVKKEPDDVDDQWFPILSQAFWDEDEVEIVEGDPPSAPSPPPSPSLPVHSLDQVSENEDNEVDLDEWWPQLSQSFFDDDIDGRTETESSESVEVPEDTSCMDQPVPSTSSCDIDSLLKKMKSSHPRTSLLTTPKTPPPRTKSSALKKRGSRCQEFYGKPLEKKRVSPPSKELSRGRDMPHKKERKRSPRISPHTKKKGKKNQSLRDNLSSKFNLAPYSKTLEKTKEKHHLVSKVESEHGRKTKDQPHTSAKTDANISIQKRNKSKSPEGDEKPRPKVAAKVTKKTRSEKLTDIDLFANLVSPTASKKSSSAASKKSKFKIPKTKDKTGEHSRKPSNVVNKEGSRSIVNKKKDSSKALTEPQRSQNTKAVDKQVAASLMPQANDDKDQQKTGTLIPESSTSKEESIDSITKGILRLLPPSSHKPKKNVHFPTNEEDLVKAMLISPRKRHDHTGFPVVRAREIQPLMLQKINNIPQYYMECFIYHVCSWNFDWLRQYHTAQEKNEARGSKKPVQPPPVGSSKNYPTLILYNSFSDYKEIFSNLIFLEVWENVYKDWVKYRETAIGLPAQLDVIQTAFIKTSSRMLTFWTLKLITLITENQSMNGYHPRQGSLISLRIHEGSKRFKIFGYVDYLVKSKKHVVTNELRKACTEGSVCLLLGVRVTKETITKVRPGSIISVNNVSYLKPNTRMWEGLCKLPLSPLCKDILQPSLQAFVCNHTCQYLVENMPVNETQHRAVVEVSSKCIYDPQIPKLSLIHGPPGTGKTRTITALIAQMVKLSEKLQSERQGQCCRVLLCAPSNAAADELTLRLGKLREIGLSLRVVRVGVRQSMRNEILGYTLDALVQKQIKIEISTPRNFSTLQEWDRRKFMVEKAAEDLQNAIKENKNKAEIKVMETRLFELVRAKAEFEKSFRIQPTMQEMHEMQQRWQEKVLLNAEVITTTLGSCMSGAMADIFSHHPGHFTCCILDEAGQCQETETWLPLLLGVKKLVLVGDHKQLPATVLSRLAQDKNLKQSLFERFYHRLVVELQEEKAVHTLKVQYRMHPEIAMWPSLHFYQGKLTTCPRIAAARTHFLKPYILFDLKTSQEKRHDGRELYNPSEASLIFNICEVLEDLKYKEKIGVITPYLRQKIHLEQRLAKFAGVIDLVISTIDAFQGQERDIIILSFVRGNNSSQIGFLSQRQRMNVALTRARKSCFVVASLSSLSDNRDCLALIEDATARGLVRTVTEKAENDKKCIRSMLEK